MLKHQKLNYSSPLWFVDAVKLITNSAKIWVFIRELHTIYFRGEAKSSTPESNSSQLGLYCSEPGEIISIFPIITRQSNMCIRPSSSAGGNCKLNKNKYTYINININNSELNKGKTNSSLATMAFIITRKTDRYLSTGCSTGERWSPCPWLRLPAGMLQKPWERIASISLFEAPNQAYFTLALPLHFISTALEYIQKDWSLALLVKPEKSTRLIASTFASNPLELKLATNFFVIVPWIISPPPILIKPFSETRFCWSFSPPETPLSQSEGQESPPWYWDGFWTTLISESEFSVSELSRRSSNSVRFLLFFSAEETWFDAVV